MQFYDSTTTRTQQMYRQVAGHKTEDSGPKVAAVISLLL